MSQPTSARTGYVLSLSAALIWSTTSVLIKYLLDMGAPRLAIAFWRDALIALACLAGLLVLRPQALRVGRRDLRGFAAVGAISVGLYHALWVTSIALNGAAVATVLIYTFPAFVTLGAWLLFHEPIRRPQILALALALIGCALVVRAYDPAVLRVSWVGALVGLSTGMTHAGYVLFSQRAVQAGAAGAESRAGAGADLGRRQQRGALAAAARAGDRANAGRLRAVHRRATPHPRPHRQPDHGDRGAGLGVTGRADPRRAHGVAAAAGPGADPERDGPAEADERAASTGAAEQRTRTENREPRTGLERRPMSSRQWAASG